MKTIASGQQPRLRLHHVDDAADAQREEERAARRSSPRTAASPSRIVGKTLSGSVIARFASISSMNGGTSPCSPSFRSSPGATNGTIAPPSEQHARGRDDEDDQARRDELVQFGASVGGVVLGHEPDEARRDAEIEEGEVREDCLDDAPDAVAGIAERRG